MLQANAYQVLVRNRARATRVSIPMGSLIPLLLKVEKIVIFTYVCT